MTFTLRRLKRWVQAFPMKQSLCVLRLMLVNALRVLISTWIQSVLERPSIPCWQRLRLTVVLLLKMRLVNLRLLMWQRFSTIWVRVYVALVQKSLLLMVLIVYMALVTRLFQTVLKRVLTLLWPQLSVRELRLKMFFMNTLKVLLLNLKQWVFV